MPESLAHRSRTALAVIEGPGVTRVRPSGRSALRARRNATESREPYPEGQPVTYWKRSTSGRGARDGSAVTAYWSKRGKL